MTAVLICLPFSPSAAAEPVSLVRLPMESVDIFPLNDAADIAAVNPKSGFVDVLVPNGRIDDFRRLGIEVKVLIDDTDAYARALRSSGYLDHFHSPDRIEAELKELAATFAMLAALHDIGDGWLKSRGGDGFDIWVLKISDHVEREEEDEAEVLFFGGIHAREIITPEILLAVARRLLEQYGRDPIITRLVDNRQIWLIPCMNPEGTAYVFTGDEEGRFAEGKQNPLWWRKNMRDNDEDGVFSPFTDGVDLNRNWAFAWGCDDIGSSPVMSNLTYRGKAPFSEPETQALRDFAGSRRFVTSICFHSYSNLWLYPWGHTHDPLPEWDLTVFKELADSCVSYNGYQPQQAAAFYLVNGYSDDWLWAECGVYAFTAEVGHPDFDGFFPDPARIPQLIEENLGPLLFLADAAGEEPRVDCRLARQRFSVGDSLKAIVTVRPPIIRITPAAVDVGRSALYYRRERCGEWTSVSLVPSDSSGAYLAQLVFEQPGLYHFYVEAVDELGRRGEWPRGAPLAADSLYVDPPAAVASNLPAAEPLLSIHPNPFNAEAKIEFALPHSAAATVDIYDVWGRRTAVLLDGCLSEGRHAVIWQGKDDDGRAIASGIYICRLRAGDLSTTARLLLLK